MIQVDFLFFEGGESPATRWLGSFPRNHALKSPSTLWSWRAIFGRQGSFTRARLLRFLSQTSPRFWRSWDGQSHYCNWLRNTAGVCFWMFCLWFLSFFVLWLSQKSCAIELLTLLRIKKLSWYMRCRCLQIFLHPLPARAARANPTTSVNWPPRQPWESLVSEGKFEDLKTQLRPVSMSWFSSGSKENLQSPSPKIEDVDNYPLNQSWEVVIYMICN